MDHGQHGCRPAASFRRGPVRQAGAHGIRETNPSSHHGTRPAPGYLATDEEALLGRPPLRLERRSARIPAGRWGTPADIGPVVVFLASDAAAYVHGQVLAVDGGWPAH